MLDNIRDSRYVVGHNILLTALLAVRLYVRFRYIATLSCAGSVVLTQTHPAAPYVCRTGNITLRCQYDDVEGVLAFLWSIGGEVVTSNPSTFTGHTANSHTATYQDLVVNNYTNLRDMYSCTAVFTNGVSQQSNEFEPQNESKHKVHSTAVTVRRIQLAAMIITNQSNALMDAP